MPAAFHTRSHVAGKSRSTNAVLPRSVLDDAIACYHNNTASRSTAVAVGGSHADPACSVALTGPGARGCKATTSTINKYAPFGRYLAPRVWNSNSNIIKDTPHVGTAIELHARIIPVFLQKRGCR